MPDLTTPKANILLFFLAGLLSACGPSQETLDATATRAVEDMFSTQTALAPTATDLPTITLTLLPTDIPTVSPTSTPLPTDTPTVVLGDRQQVPEGGFSYRPIPGYTVDADPGESGTVIAMTAPDADLDVGPALVIAGGLAEDTPILDELADDFVDEMFAGNTDIQVSERHEVTVDGAPGLVVEIGGSVDGRDIIAKVVFVQPTPMRLFVLFGVAPAESWQSEIEQLFQAVLASVTLLEPVGAVTITPTDEATPPWCWEWETTQRVSTLTLTRDDTVYLAAMPVTIIREDGTVGQSAVYYPLYWMSIRNDGSEGYEWNPRETLRLVSPNDVNLEAERWGTRPTWHTLRPEPGEEFADTQPIAVGPGQDVVAVVIFESVDASEEGELEEEGIPPAAVFQDRSFESPVPLDPSYWGAESISPDVEAKLRSAKTFGNMCFFVKGLETEIIPQ